VNDSVLRVFAGAGAARHIGRFGIVQGLLGRQVIGIEVSFLILHLGFKVKGFMV
jgi:hypothetical protein